jgi:hypothetical protein
MFWLSSAILEAAPLILAPRLAAVPREKLQICN